MKRRIIVWSAALAAAGTGAMVAAVPAAPAEPANGGVPVASESILRSNAINLRQITRLRRSPQFLVRTRVVTPSPDRQVGMFDSAGTVVVKAPRGTEVAVGAFRNIPDPNTAFKITSVNVNARRNAYVLQVLFPGSQGNPPRLRVSVAGMVPGDAIPVASPALRRQNARNRTAVRKLEDNPAFVVDSEEVLPQPTRFRGFDAFGTVVFRAPPGRTARLGFFQNIPVFNSQFTITGARVVRSRNAYVVNVKWPGSQGLGPKLRLFLASN